MPNTTTNPSWEGFDSEYPQGPLCRTDNYCGNGDFGRATAQGPVPGWLWFGFAKIAGQTGWARQTVTIPYGQATLRYWYRFGVVSAPYDATFTVSLDGDRRGRARRNRPEHGEGYVEDIVNVSTWANGAAHVLRFDYAKPSTATADRASSTTSLWTSIRT